MRGEVQIMDENNLTDKKKKQTKSKTKKAKQTKKQKQNKKKNQQQQTQKKQQILCQLQFCFASSSFQMNSLNFFSETKSCLKLPELLRK